MAEIPVILGVILAGGQSRRMSGRNKAEISLGGRRLVDIVAARLAPQVDRVVLSGPGGLGLDIPNILDEAAGVFGPLAGVLSAYGWAGANIAGRFAIITAAVDTPFFPEDLAKRLKGDGPALAAVAGAAQTTFGYWPDTAEEDLSAYLEGADNPSIQGFLRDHAVRMVAFENREDFFNINTPEDLAMAEKFEREMA